MNLIVNIEKGTIHEKAVEEAFDNILQKISRTVPACEMFFFVECAMTDKAYKGVSEKFHDKTLITRSSLSTLLKHLRSE